MTALLHWKQPLTNFLAVEKRLVLSSLNPRETSVAVPVTPQLRSFQEVFRPSCGSPPDRLGAKITSRYGSTPAMTSASLSSIRPAHEAEPLPEPIVRPWQAWVATNAG